MSDQVDEVDEVEVRRRWAIKKILIDHKLHCAWRQEHRKDPMVWPSLHDVYDIAIDRLDRLYAGETSADEMHQECEDSQWE